MDISVWYGSPQYFSVAQKHQDCINILGRVTDPTGVDSLSYALAHEGQRLPVCLGPTAFRLYGPGDFNLEINYDRLQRGDNLMTLWARNGVGKEFVKEIRVVLQDSRLWEFPVHIDFSTAKNIDERKDGGEIGSVSPDRFFYVDGLWRRDKNGVYPVELGYDRLIGFGDRSWNNFELVLKLWYNEYSCKETAYGWPSGGPGFGIGLGWQGHVDWHDIRPRRGYLPLGALIWYRHGREAEEDLYIQSGSEHFPLSRLAGCHKRIAKQGPFYLKARFTRQDNLNRYKVKAWKTTQQEPKNWDLDQFGMDGENKNGSILLIAHHSRVVFGEIDARKVT